MGDPEVFKNADVIAFKAIMALTAVSIAVKVICNTFMDDLFDIMDRWCKHRDAMKRDKEQM